MSYRKVNIFTYVLSVTFIWINTSFSQGPGEAFNPMTAIGAKEIWTFNHQLFWENPTSILYNEVYISTDSSVVINIDTSARILNGYPSTVYTSTDLSAIQPLAINTIYYWSVVEYDSSTFSIGKLWWFETTCIQLGPVWFEDDFENGLGNWAITNDGGNCVWENLDIFSNNYELNSTGASGLLIAADSDQCGPGTTLLSTATLDSIFGAQSIIFLELDMDWRTIDSEDEAHIEISTDYDENWESVRSWIGIDHRNASEFIDLSSFVGNCNFMIRFRVVQPGWDWWWVIDNVRLSGPITPFIPARNLLVFVNQEIPNTVSLTWMLSNLSSESFIERKAGLPLDNTPYVQIGEVGNFINSFIDTTAFDSIYTYRIRSEQGGYFYSNEATAYIPDIITQVESKKELPTEFSLFQNYPNPFNPSTKFKYQIPELSFVTMKVYDVLGNEITTLVNEEKPVGSYQIEFDASGLPSGIYFYRLQAGSFVETRKMVLMK
jgi:hypothetical protein